MVTHSNHGSKAPEDRFSAIQAIFSNPKDPLGRYARRHWPRECFPSRVAEGDVYGYVLWRFIRAKRAHMARREAWVRPPVILRIGVRISQCRLARALRTIRRALHRHSRRQRRKRRVRPAPPAEPGP